MRTLTQCSIRSIGGDDLFAVITLDRTEKRNALNNRLIDSIRTRMEQVTTNPFVRAIILTGAGGTFCAGADLTELSEANEKNGNDPYWDGVGLVVSCWERLFEKVRRSPKPTIAVVHGAALGGGAALASVCDYVILDPKATMGYPETTRGIIPALASVYLLRQVGERQASRLLIGGEIVDAEEAVRIGLATFVRDDPMRCAEELAGRIAKCGPKALAGTKKIIRNRPAIGDASHIAYRHLISGEAREGLASFVENRKPDWSSSLRRNNNG